MAIVPGTGLTTTTNGQREDLSDIITNISPLDTPFRTAIGKGEADVTFVEWQADALAAAAANAKIEGDEASFSTPTTTQRLGNRTQISSKTVVVSRTADRVRKAGRGDELGYQVLKYGRELLRDIEFECTGKNGIVTGNSTTARQAAGFETWVTSNVSAGTSYASVAKSASIGVVAGQPTAGATQTDGTVRAFDEEDLKTVNQACWTQGGQPTLLIVGPFNKRVVSGFTGNATRTIDAGGKRLQSAIDVYAHDFGELTVAANRFSRDRTAMVVDPDYWEFAWLDPIQMEPLAKTGDASKRLLVCEWTLKALNEASSGKVADLATS
jgi:hypothetical protein